MPLREKIARVSTACSDATSKHKRKIPLAIFIAVALAIPVFITGIPEFAQEQVDSDEPSRRFLGYIIRGVVAAWTVLYGVFALAIKFIAISAAATLVCMTTLAIIIGAYRLFRFTFNRMRGGNDVSSRSRAETGQDDA
ncbi:hypothetical protein [Tsukamurella paurometabola]|uniref:hypothetical protein n=1 Tax=Tsukamurella paurometabola TaxID=2061 RepID=UPI000F7E44DA|nr:hypothetical protein [Tsukamurella paurometabola]UEA81632.1 hypothetical protein LK411_14640 [Tsukamurella paurometabola]